MEKQLGSLTTESRNETTMQIDTDTTKDILEKMNEEDQKVAIAVRKVLPEVELAVEFTVNSLKKGGRLIYLGAGTSGRLGVLDAVECPPTFGSSPESVLALMAGGENAFIKAVEGAEDKMELGEEDLKRIQLTADDTVIGIAASGRTPYVIGALNFARSAGAKTVALSCNEGAEISKAADLAIEVITGPESLTGSTRMKAATAHKMILNMISTASMIKLGKVYENLMVDVNVSNFKLKERAISIIQTVTGNTREKAKEALEEANHQVKPAIVMLNTGTSYKEALSLLEQANGFVRQAIEFGKK
ncbi:N-acetylmuramic acid 6-phosphate etherase [Metabacillus sp. RGM 3146]|uniref:N-acetylmuramic acid 6-phosphate etherase n=1 Tax=Metabacillus sp. RGM 3146 TaxID=3401092 RepID=UPI003B9A252A